MDARWTLLLMVAGCSAGHAATTSQEAPVTAAAPAAPAPADDAPAAKPAAVLATGPLNDGCSPAAGAGHQTITCKDGTAFEVDVSDNCAAGGCGAILDVHGWSMNGNMQDRHTRMRALAGPKGFVIVQPTAPGSPPSWSTGDPLGRNFDFDDTVWGFFQATLQRFGADPDRVHMTGFSQGGMMTFRFLYLHGDTFASVAPISGPDGFAIREGTILPDMAVQAPPANKIPVMYTHGTRDKLLDFDKTAVPLKDAIVKAYGLGAPETIKTETALRASKYAVDGRTMLEWWEHDYAQGNIYIGGHCVAGPIQDGDGSFLDQDKTPYRCIPDDDHPTIDLDLGSEIVRFFTEHPRGK